MVLVTIQIPQLLLNTVIDAPIMHVVQIIPVVAQRRLPMVFQTTETPQLTLDTVVDVLVFLVMRVPQLPVMEETVVLAQLQIVELRP